MGTIKCFRARGFSSDYWFLNDAALAVGRSIAGVLGWPLTGRDEELKCIADLVAGREGGGVVLSGDAGAGKTRLARDALARAGAQGAVTRWAVGTAAAADIPLGAVAHLVALPERGPLPSPFVLLRHAAERLVADAGGHPLVVGVDDAHLLDPLSATLVQQLALTGAARLVLTVRAGQPVCDTLVSLWKDEIVGRLDVPALSRPHLARLVETVLGGPVESVSLAHLWDVTRGNPLFVRLLVEGELETGRLLEVAGVWRWRGTLAAGSALTEVVEARLAGLDPGARDVLEHLAFGEPLGVALVEELVGPGALGGLEQRRLVSTEASAGRFEARLAHPLYGEVLRSRATRTRRRQISGALADAIASCGIRREGDVLKVAVLRVDSDGPADPVLLTRATALAIGLLDMGLAERLGRAAIAAGAGLEARLVVSTAISFQGRPEEAKEELERTAALVQSDEDRARVTIMRAANLFWSLRRPSEGERVLREAEHAAVSAGPGSLELRGLQAAFAYHLARPREAVETGEEVLASPEASDMALAWAAAAAACAWARLGNGDRAAEVADLGNEAVRRAPHASVLEGALAWGEIMADLLVGQLDRAAETAVRFQARSLLAAPSDVSPLGALFIGIAALSRGRVVTASGWLREGLAALSGQDAAGWEWFAHIHAIQAHGMAGGAVEARRALEESAATRHPSMVVYEADYLLALAWVAAAEGVLGEACSHARAAADLAAAQGVAAVEVHAWHTLVRMGGITEAVEAAAHLGALAGVVQGPFVLVAADHAVATADSDGAALDRAAAAFEAMGADLLAADAFAHATAAHRDAGRRAAANASGARVRALVERCEGARTPAIAAADLPLPISGREREVALLAARGLSNRQIAERLVVSVRTVESHLYQASAKLGVAGREGLAEALRPSSFEQP